MIAIGETDTSLQLVQVVKGLGAAVEGEPIESNPILDVAQWEPTADYFCEFSDDGQCDSGTVCWGTSDPYEPRFCTKHFYDGSIGYDFVAVA